MWNTNTRAATIAKNALKNAKRWYGHSGLYVLVQDAEAVCTITELRILAKAYLSMSKKECKRLR